VHPDPSPGWSPGPHLDGVEVKLKVKVGVQIQHPDDQSQPIWVEVSQGQVQGQGRSLGQACGSGSRHLGLWVEVKVKVKNNVRVNIQDKVKGTVQIRCKHMLKKTWLHSRHLCLNAALVSPQELRSEFGVGTIESIPVSNSRSESRSDPGTD